MTKNTDSKDKDFHNDILRDLGVTNDFDGVSTADLSAEEKRLEVQIKRLELEEKIEAQTKRRSKKLELKREFEAKLRAIQVFLAQREALQRGCNHKKGGVGKEAVIHGQGTDENYALLKHQLPSGDWLIQCQRCSGEWYPEDRFTGRPATTIGGFTYRDALMARTDNSPSKSAVFKFTDTRTPEQVEADRYKPPVDEQGNPVKDTLALPAHAQFTEPPQPSRSLK
jgi:hypothetical protein